MRKFIPLVACFITLLGAVARAADDAAALEARVAEAVKSPKVTIVHFWATWCPNCKAELANGGWRDFVNANPDIQFIFIASWDAKPGAPVLESYGLGAQSNFTALQHPNASRKDGEKMSSLLGLPVSWLPTTWVFRDGKLRYAVNYGELRFAMLQQMVADSLDKWKH
jgi:thiol-disulfide isomerase/thioredoxin